ncbi:MAG: S41 family peptidase [Bryobacteraceae bacterium]
MSSRAKFLIVVASTSLVVLLVFGAVAGKSASPEGPYRHLAVFTEVLSRIKSEYVEEPDMKSVTLGALNGLLESVDPFASYLSAEQYKEYVKKKDSAKGDVGVMLAKRAGYVAVVASLPGSPAAQAGINSGDWIEAIKGVATRDMPLAYAELLLRGDPGTTIEVSVFRSRRPEPQKITLKRAAVANPSIHSEMMPDQIGYIRTETLVPGKPNDVASAISKLEGQGAKRILLDLRNCSFGPPEQGVELANLFLDKGLITYIQGQKVPRQNFEADARKMRTKLPLQVLTNRGTAGGCEVAAAALLDNKRGEFVGERTFGSAAVRRTVTLDDGAAIILATAKYYSPSGKAIPDNGVMPPKLLVEAEAQVEVDEDGNPLPQDENAPKKDPGAFIRKAIEMFGHEK